MTWVKKNEGLAKFGATTDYWIYSVFHSFSALSLAEALEDLRPTVGL